MTRTAGTDWSLADAEALHEMHPRSFFIPPAYRRRDLRPDDCVRLAFQLQGDRQPGYPSAERMWLTDIKRRGEGRYVGTLTNRPAVITDLAHGDEIEFGPEHVIAVWDPEAIPNDIKAFAARRLIDDDTLTPGYVYHDPSEADRPPRNGRRSSGWCLLVGDETEEQLADPGQLLVPSLGWLAERYPAFGDILHSGVAGREYEWDPGKRRYRDIGPFQENDE